MEPAPKPRIIPKQSSALADNEGSNSDYNDDFEKEDVVKVADHSSNPHRAAKKKQQHIADRQTKESSQEPGSDSHSLMRDISVRGKLDTAKNSSSLPPTRMIAPKNTDLYNDS